jgi:phosphotransacetylase
MLSYSTNGSGGKNPDLEKIHFVIDQTRNNHPDWLIDGEMQLDAAIIPEISQKKFADSQIAGQANILIVPDLNSGNILYKAMERFGGFTCAGPIIQGFEVPLADLSRGSTAEDVRLTLDVIIRLFEYSNYVSRDLSELRSPLGTRIAEGKRDRRGAAPSDGGRRRPRAREA